MELLSPAKNGTFSPLIEEDIKLAREHFGKLGAPEMGEHGLKVTLAAGEGRLLDLHAGETDIFSRKLTRRALFHSLISENYLPEYLYKDDDFVRWFRFHNRVRELESMGAAGLSEYIRLLNDPANDLTDVLFTLYARLADAMIIHDPATTAAAAKTSGYAKTIMSKIFPVYSQWDEAKVAFSASMLAILLPIADWGGQTDAYRKVRDNAMFYLYPNEYRELEEKFRRIHSAFINTHRAMWCMARDMSKRLNVNVLVAYDSKTAVKALEQAGPNTVVMIMRPFKGVGGLLKKQIERGQPAEHAHDKAAYKVITKSTEVLYRAMSYLYEEGIRRAARAYGSPDVFVYYPKDYVVDPKPITLYQAIHIDTVVSDGNLVNFEGQGCTLDMHKWADEGGASHDDYKGAPVKNGERRRLMAQLDSITSRSS